MSTICALSLLLFVAGILADNIKVPLAADGLALRTNLFYRCSNAHIERYYTNYAMGITNSF